MSMDPDAIQNTIQSAAERGVQVYQSDSERVEQHSIDGLIKADKYARLVQGTANKSTLACRVRGMFMKIRPR